MAKPHAQPNGGDLRHRCYSSYAPEAICHLLSGDGCAVVLETEDKEPLPWEGIDPASYYMKARRERIQAAVTQKPRDAVHGMLKVLPAQELPRTIDEVLNRAPKKKVGKLKAANMHGRLPH